MIKVMLSVVGAAFIVIVSFVATLRMIDYFRLFSPAPTVSLVVAGKGVASAGGAYIIPKEGNYNVSYSTSGAASCELKYHNAENGTSGQQPIRPNIAEAAPSGLVGEYTLTCLSSTGASTSKTVRTSRSSK